MSRTAAAVDTAALASPPTGLPARFHGEPAKARALLRSRVAAALRRWPLLEASEATLTEAVWPPGAPERGPETLAALDALHLEDLLLAGACVRGQRAALAVLEHEVLSQVPRWVARFAGVDADEVRQALLQKLLLGPAPHLLDYGGRGALQRWVRVAAGRCAIDLQRRLRHGHDGGDGEGGLLDPLFAGPDPELDFVKLHDRAAVHAVLRDAVGALPPRDLALLRLHYLEGLSLEQLAELEQVHRATVARWLAAAREAALEQVRALLLQRLRLTTREGDSLVRFLGSKLELSLRSVLGAGR